MTSLPVVPAGLTVAPLTAADVSDAASLLAAAATGRRSVHLGQIGVLPSARGRGLATATIAASLRAAAGAGCQVAELEVDSDNTTGALRLYEGLGFTAVRTQITWSTTVSPVTGG